MILVRVDLPGKRHHRKRKSQDTLSDDVAQDLCSASMVVTETPSPGKQQQLQNTPLQAERAAVKLLP
jgi:hypothetical protein